MRVAHLACVSPPEIGGIGQAAYQEVKSLEEQGIQAEIVSLTTDPRFRLGNMGLIRHLKDHIRGADIVHLHYPFFGTAEQIVCSSYRRLFSHLIFTLHMDATAAGFKGFAFNLHRKYIQPSLLAKADALIVSSKDYAVHSSYVSVASQVKEIPFGVDETFFSPERQQPELFSLPLNAPRVLFVGGMDHAHAFKGVDILLRAIALIPDAHLVLIGDGALRSMYEALAATLGIASRCHFLGRADREMLRTAYRTADLLVLPSISGAEAFGLVVLEAQACGIPVIASDLPGVRTVVAHQETGLLVPPGDVQALTEALRALLFDQATRQRYGEAARHRIIKWFTWKRHMELLMNVYQSVCASPS